MSSSAEPDARFDRRGWLMTMLTGLAAPALRGEGLRQLVPSGPPLEEGLATLIARMKKGAAAKDAALLEALMLPDFRVEFDSGKGPLAFRRHWRPEQAGSALWTLLPRLLNLPGSFYSPSLYSLPFVYTHFPVDLDPLAHVVAVGTDIPLRREPEAGASSVGTLASSIVPLAVPLRPPVLIRPDRFLEVVHPDAGRCFVAGADVYSPAGHRIFFEKRKGQWRWISLAAATLADSPELAPRGKGGSRP